MDLASFLEALPAAQLDSVYASQVRASVFLAWESPKSQECCCSGGGILACWL
jgi:hypothetical protein